MVAVSPPASTTTDPRTRKRSRRRPQRQWRGRPSAKIAIRVKSAVRSPVAVQTPAAPTEGSISPPSAVKTLVVGISVGSAGLRSTIQVPTSGWPAIASGVASWAARWSHAAAQAQSQSSRRADSAESRTTTPAAMRSEAFRVASRNSFALLSFPAAASVTTVRRLHDLSTGLTRGLRHEQDPNVVIDRPEPRIEEDVEGH